VATSHVLGESDYPNDVLADREYPKVGQLDAFELYGYGYRWIRLRRTPFS